ncbi:MAG: hypothetical protein HY259_04160 [Chloroflexi bacterium]|nr:hypothetical protein [Chloroflexota bacterium]
MVSLIAVALLAACGAVQPAPTAVPPPSTPAPVATPTPLTFSIAAAKDITYTVPLQPDVSAQALDVYAPTERKGWPLVVFLHGLGEGKRDYTRISQAMAERGLVVFTLEWPDRTVSIGERENGKGYRQVFETLACGVRFARASAPGYGGDPKRLALVGFSLGAGVGASLAFAGDNPERAWQELAAGRGAPPPQTKCVAEGGSARVDAFVGVAGAYGAGTTLQNDNPPLWQIINPYVHLGDTLRLNVRVRLLHGTFDSRVPMESSVAFNDALTKAGYDSRLVKFDGSHAVPMPLTLEEVLKLWQ